MHQTKDLVNREGKSCSVENLNVHIPKSLIQNNILVVDLWDYMGHQKKDKIMADYVSKMITEMPNSKKYTN